MNGGTGLKFFAVSGHVEKPDVYCVPMGTTTRELIELAGGVSEGRELLAFQPGGASSNFLGPDGLDVPLVFGNLRRGQPAMLIGEAPSAEAEALSTRMRAAWTAFAAHGDPGWPAYDAGQRLTQLFDARPAVTAYPEEASRLIWQDHTFSALPLIFTSPERRARVWSRRGRRERR